MVTSLRSLLCSIPLAASLSLSSITLADAATFDKSLAKTPCAVITPEMVATTLNVPSEDMPQPNSLAPMCSYQMEKNDKVLEITLMVSVFDTEKAATEAFRENTRSMSLEEVSEKLRELGIEFDESDRQFARDMGLPEPQPTGIQFEEVGGIGDRARFETKEGTLYFQQSNLLITLAAFYGPAMSIPDTMNFKALSKAESVWKEDTLEERKNQAIALAKVAVTAR